MEKNCDECTLCCQLTYVPEFKKKENIWCQYCNKGCDIYETRPESCKNFRCGWIDSRMALDMRPDKVHMIIEKLSGVPVMLALVDPEYNNKWITPDITNTFKRYYTGIGISIVSTDGQCLLAEGYTAHDVMVLVKKAAKAMGAI